MSFEEVLFIKVANGIIMQYNDKMVWLITWVTRLKIVDGVLTLNIETR